MIKIPIYNTKTKEEVEADPAIFGVRSSPLLIAQAVKIFLGNQRKAFAKTKTRAEIVGSGAKIWRQKGTGRARHGNRKAPIFVGGGVSFGPTGRENYKKNISKKMAQKATLSALSGKLREKKLYLLGKTDFKKTKEAAVFIKQARENLGLKGKIGVVMAGKEEGKRSFSNLPKVEILSTNSLNPYFILAVEVLFLTEKALSEMKENYFKKENKNGL